MNNWCIMWQSIEQAIKTETGEQFTIEKKRLISTSESNLAYQLSNKHHHYFIKIKDKNHFNHFESEAYALNQIRSLKQITCPEVIALLCLITFHFHTLPKNIGII